MVAKAIEMLEYIEQEKNKKQKKTKHETSCSNGASSHHNRKQNSTKHFNLSLSLK